MEDDDNIEEILSNTKLRRKFFKETKSDEV